MFSLTSKEFDNTKNPSRKHTYILVYMIILWAFYVISVYINPDTFENSVLVSNRSVHVSFFQKFLNHTETSENVKFALLRMCKILIKDYTDLI